MPSLVNVLGDSRGVAVVDITESDNVAESAGALDVARAHAAAADERDARAVVRGRDGGRLLLRGLELALDEPQGESCGRGNRGAILDERSA